MSKESDLKEIEINFQALTRENKERLIYFADILKRCEGLPVEQQQEIFDEIQDEVLLKFLEEHKKSLS